VSPSRSIRESLASPGPLTYLSAAAVGALVVFSLAGFLAHGVVLREAAAFKLLAQVPSLALARPVPAFAEGNTQRGDSVWAQRVYVDASATGITPSRVSVRAGVPTVMSVSGGAQCVSKVRFEGFEARGEVRGEDGVVRIPALEPGSYEYSCCSGAPQGLVVAE